MSLEILVAVDISDGRVVRLTRGEMAQLTVYDKDPVATAVGWEQQGARWLHVVDLDAAMGTGDNSNVIEKLLSHVTIPVEVGGGIRSIPDVAKWIKAGAARVCIGTRSIDEDFLAGALEASDGKVVVSVDAKDGIVQLEGWRRTSGRSVADVCNLVEQAGVRKIMFTDINRDGTMQGPNFPATEALLSELERLAAQRPDGKPPALIASGGVSSRDDIGGLAKLSDRGLEAVVVGRALYSGDLTLSDALVAAG